MENIINRTIEIAQKLKKSPVVAQEKQLTRCIESLFDSKQSHILSVSVHPLENATVIECLMDLIQTKKSLGKNPHLHQIVAFHPHEGYNNDITMIRALEEAEAILFVHDLKQGVLDSTEIAFLMSVQAHWKSVVHFLEKTILVFTNMDNLPPEESQDISSTIKQQIQYLFHVDTYAIGWQIVNTHLYVAGKAENDPEQIAESNIEMLKQFINELTYRISIRPEFSDERKQYILEQIPLCQSEIKKFGIQLVHELQLLHAEKEQADKKLVQFLEQYQFDVSTLLSDLLLQMTHYLKHKKSKKKSRQKQKDIKARIREHFDLAFHQLAVNYAFPSDMTPRLKKVKKKFVEKELTIYLKELFADSFYFIEMQKHVESVQQILQEKMTRSCLLEEHLSSLNDLQKLIEQYQ